MKKTDEISSTEKLLHVIRNRNENSLQDTEDVRDEFREMDFSPSLLTVLPFQKKITLSIIIGNHDVMLVLLSRVSDQNWNLLDHKKIPFVPEMKKDPRQFSVFLRSSILQFLGNRKPDYIWSSIPSASIETRFLTIPKVSVNQIPKVAYFSFNKVIPINGEGLVFDFEVLGEVSQGGSPKLKIFAYTALSTEVEQVRKLFANIGFPLTGISIVPFAIQNLIRTQLVGSLSDNICTLYVGKDWSRIDIFSKGNLVLSRDIKTGINSIVDAVRSRIDKNDDESGNLSLLKERYGDEAEPEHQNQEEQEISEKIFRDLIINDSEASLEEKSRSLGNEEIVEIIIPVIKRLVRQVERTFEHFTVNFDHESIGKIFITGELTAHRHIIDLISKKLNFTIDCIDPFQSESVHIPKNDIPDSAAERDSFVPGIGLAISHNNRTPNLLYTYLQKGIINKIRKINQYVFFAFIAVISVCIGFFYWQDHAMRVKKDQIDRLHVQLAGYSPLVEKNLILKMISALEKKRNARSSRAEKSLSSAIILELSQKTPDNIRLTKMDARLFPDPSVSTRKKLLLIEGVVFQKGSSLDADLAVYVLKLGESPIFKQVSIREKTIKIINGEKVLQFIAKLEPV